MMYIFEKGLLKVQKALYFKISIPKFLKQSLQLASLDKKKAVL